MKRILTTTIAMLCGASFAFAQDHNPIKVNQVGYYPNQEKTASVEKEAEAKTYVLVDAKGKTVWKGQGTRKAVSKWSDKEREIVDFSSVTVPGEYTLKAGKLTQKVIIKEHALAEVAKASVKAFYLQRTGEPILEEYAGKYARPAAHPDTCVLVHAAAATEARPEGFKISSPGGWYDAGDFNKYIVNSAYTIGLMLNAYEMNPDYFNKMELNIPESKNATPDYLDELYFNLKWMLTMQDPNDGGVYHKLTTPSFEAFIMPVQCRQQRYVTQKSTSAALDFAAVMAQSSRVFGKYPAYADFAKKALEQADYAYRWAEKNNNVPYTQGENSKKFKPAISTGEYGDRNFKDEFFWATVELFITTQDTRYLQNLQTYAPESFSIPSWGNVYGLGAYSMIAQILNTQNQYGQAILGIVKPLVTKYADDLMASVPTSCYNSPYGNVPNNFHWGCLAEGCCGQGIALLYSYRLTGNKKYLTGAIENMDYILGRNATGYCYVTGFGQTPSMHPHQRLSAADGIEAPLPGFLVGGPNPGQQDKAPNLPAYPSNHPDESYLDHEASYASNEIAINWNAALAALSGWIEAEIK